MAEPQEWIDRLYTDVDEKIGQKISELRTELLDPLLDNEAKTADALRLILETRAMLRTNLLISGANIAIQADVTNTLRTELARFRGRLQEDADPLVAYVDWYDRCRKLLAAIVSIKSVDLVMPTDDLAYVLGHKGTH